MAGLEGKDMGTGWASLRVLVADDNVHMRSIIVGMLKGIEVTAVYEAKDGQDAYEALGRWPADLAIVDFNMQPTDGIAFTRLVRQDPGTPNPYLPIIMLTGHSEESRVEEARDAGVNEFLVKPINVKALLGRLNEVVYRQRAFIRSSTYFGPDRRRRDSPHHSGPWRRESDRQSQSR
jgi:CheY-like chemotaxis protein